MDTIESAFQHVNVTEAIDFWKPIGIIAECGSRSEEMNRKANDFLALLVIPNRSRPHFTALTRGKESNGPRGRDA